MILFILSKIVVRVNNPIAMSSSSKSKQAALSWPNIKHKERSALVLCIILGLWSLPCFVYKYLQYSSWWPRPVYA